MQETIVILLGLIFGSFTNVLIYRLPRGESVVFPASRCPSCGQPLKAGDLLPVLSYLFLKGRCRYCKAGISPRYPLVEALTAAAFLLVYICWGLSLTTLSGMVLSLVLICAGFTDLDTGLIPDRLTIPAVIIGLGLSVFTVGIKAALIGGLGYGGLFLALALISRGGMGGGDIKLAAVIGVFCGWPLVLTALVLVGFMGGFYALFLLLSGKANRKSEVRFGPLLSLGAFLAFNYGMVLSSWYLSWFH
ncbi:MAG: prepilin peptidase [Syntrophomonadaceae bacterium]|jgi:leader peptidase (prepilin peptidase)/N-methyltransferase